MTEHEKARALAVKLQRLKAGARWGYRTPMVHPKLHPEDRDLIVKALECFGGGEQSEKTEGK